MSEAAQKVERLSTIIAPMRSGPTEIKSADGVTLYSCIQQYRTPVELKYVPKFVIKAILAAEDKRFYQHQGVDAKALARHLATNLKEQRTAGGASTLTMQLAKRIYSNSEQTMSRKIDDIVIALQIERQYTKDQILELYLNEVYYGSGAYGIAAAAEVYFGKKLGALTLSEAATIARLVRRPSDENPFTNMKKSIENRDVVLSVMLEEGWASRAEYEAAKKEKVVLAKLPERNATIKAAPYFVTYVLDEIKNNPDIPSDVKANISIGGYTIETTLDSKVQETSDEEAKSIVRRYRRSGVTTAAFVLIDKDGQVIAMTGGIDFEKRQFTVVTQWRRQPGSRFKPFVYSLAFEKGMTPSDGISNETYTKRQLGHRPWVVEGGGGTVSIKEAITWSKNAVAVRVMEAVGPSDAVAYAKSVFGFTGELPAVPSLVLGSVAVSPMEMATAYSVLQSHGTRVKPWGIKVIKGPDGNVVYRGESIKIKTAMGGAAADMIDECLRSVALNGTGRAAGGIRNAHGKTGTTNDSRDAWFCGYTNSYIGIGWVASEHFENGKWEYHAMPASVMGGTVTVNMWHDILQKAQQVLGEDKRSSESDSGASQPGFWGSEIDGSELRRGKRTRKTEEKPPATDPTSQDPTADPNAGEAPADSPQTSPNTRPRDGKPKTDPAPTTPPDGGGDLPEGVQEPGFNGPG